MEIDFEPMWNQCGRNLESVRICSRCCMQIQQDVRGGNLLRNMFEYLGRPKHSQRSSVQNPARSNSKRGVRRNLFPLAQARSVSASNVGQVKCKRLPGETGLRNHVYMVASFCPGLARNPTMRPARAPKYDTCGVRTHALSEWRLEPPP